MRSRLIRQALAAATASIAALAALPSMAAGDAVYHTQHMALEPVGDAPLRSGFVQNIKANGPTIYAHEVYVLTGAAPRTTYTVTNNFFEGASCIQGTEDSFETAELRTNRAGNARADIVFVPDDVAGLEGIHGVMWTIQNAAGEDVLPNRLLDRDAGLTITRARWVIACLGDGRVRQRRLRTSSL